LLCSASETLLTYTSNKDLVNQYPGKAAMRIHPMVNWMLLSGTMTVCAHVYKKVSLTDRL